MRPPIEQVASLYALVIVLSQGVLGEGPELYSLASEVLVCIQMEEIVDNNTSEAQTLHL